MAPIDTERYPISPRPGWNDTCIAFGFLIQYFSLSSALATLWICINVFALSVFNVTIGKRGCEVGGYIVMFLVPCLVFWIPIVSNSFGQTSVWCWIRRFIKRRGFISSLSWSNLSTVPDQCGDGLRGGGVVPD